MLGHTAAGGRLPGTGVLLAVFGGLVVLGTVLFGARQRRFDVTVLVLGGVQFVLHVVFHLLSGNSPHATTAGLSNEPQALPHSHHGMPMQGVDPPTASGGEALASAGHAMNTTMTAGHALAAFGTALCLVFGERLLCRLWALLRSDLHCLARVVLQLPPDHRPWVPATRSRPFVESVLTRCRPRRGPPLVLPA
ncbi:hypothetical protein [Streptomyces sp. NPDC051776]|uniref:hypothetical protein n=1 Tax=Streptomyces sp. NPDC051776 TaxID=3155414 RepID=UPI003432723F